MENSIVSFLVGWAVLMLRMRRISGPHFRSLCRICVIIGI